MPAKVLPDITTLRRMADNGMTYSQIVEKVYQDTGERVTRQAISAALNRAGAGKDVIRYLDVIPWTVRAQHNKHYAARMLRLVGRKQRGVQLSETDQRKLESWLRLLDDNGAVVTYEPDTEEGFFYVARRPGDLKLIRPPAD